jgi:hypothetical protein
LLWSTWIQEFLGSYIEGWASWEPAQMQAFGGGMAMDAHKQMLIDHICDQLPELLRQHGGRMLKTEARPIVEARFRTMHGWHRTLDGHKANAWGWATRRLSGEPMITRRCTRSRYYELAGAPAAVRGDTRDK